MSTPPGEAPRTVAGIEALVRDFEAARIPSPMWHHREHLTVAAWYLIHYPQDEATRLIRTGIQSLNAANGVAQTPEGGYHDTLTILFARKIAALIREHPSGTPHEEVIEAVVRALTGNFFLRAYYSRERMMSWAARTGWVEPDLKPLDF